MEANNVRALLTRYYEGATTLAEEQQLHTYLARNDVPADLRSEREQFQAWADLRAEDPGETLGYDRLFQKIEATTPAKRHAYGRKRWVSGVAASVALLLVGFMGGIWYGQEATTTEVAALREEFAGMRQTLLFTQLQQASASERIQAIQASRSSEDSAASEALLFTLSADPNVNVRLAAVEALDTFAEQVPVRSALATALREQDHPMVQIAIINQLVRWNEKRAVDELQRLVQNEQVDQVVRQQAEYGISQLML